MSEAALPEDEGLLAPLPALPAPKRPTPADQQSASPQPSPSPAPSQSQSPSSSTPGPTTTTTTGSSEPKPDRPDRPKVEPPKPTASEVTEALTESVDVALEVLCAGAHFAHARALHGKPLPEGAWEPTDAERRRISAPAGRIVRRHVPDIGVVDADAIDAALIGASLLRLSLRSTMGPDKTEVIDAESHETTR